VEEILILIGGQLQPRRKKPFIKKRVSELQYDRKGGEGEKRKKKRLRGGEGKKPREEPKESAKDRNGKPGVTTYPLEATRCLGVQ